MTRLISLLAAILLVTAACGSDDAKSGETTTSQSATATTVEGQTTTSATQDDTGSTAAESDETTTTDAGGPTTTAAVNAEIDMNVTDTGAEPRQVLRYDFKAGVRNVTTVMDASASQTVDGTPVREQASPTQTVNAVQEITEVNDGTATATQTINEILFDGKAPTGELKTKADQAMARPVEVKFASDGTPEIISPKSQQEQAAAATSVNIQGDTVTKFPEEAVGVGATWEVNTKITSQGLVLDNKVTYTLTKIDGNLVTIESVGEATVPKGTELPPQEGSAATGTIEEFGQRVEATEIYDLSWPWPIEKTTSSTARQFIRVTQNGTTAVAGVEQKQTAELTSDAG